MVIDAPADGDVTLYELTTIGERGRVRDLPALATQAVRIIADADRRGLVLLVAGTFVRGGLVAVEAFAAQAAVGAALTAYAQRSGVGAALPPVLVFLAATVLSGAISAYSTTREELLGERVTAHAQALVADAAVRAPLVAFDTPEFSNRLQRASMAMHQPLNLVRSLMTALQSLATLVAALVTLLVIAPWLALAVPLALVPMLIAFLRRGDAFYSFAYRMTPAERERQYLVSVLTDREAAKEVRAFGVGPFLRARFEQLTRDRLDRLRPVLRSQLVASVTAAVATGLLTGVLVIGLLELALSGRLGLTQLTVGSGLVALVGARVGGFGWAFSTLWESALFLRNVSDVADVPADETSRSAGGAPAGDLESLSLHSVSFSYPTSPQPVLHDVDLTVAAGEVVALVGENGSGKTTLAKLIGGFYAPSAGVITWNGRPLAELDLASRREQVTVLFQDFVRYLLTAGLNIGLGHPAAVDDPRRIEEAAQRAGADEVVEALAARYETLLGPTFVGGTDLSGGQWQRIALARALVRDASLVVLDEPTAALDPRAEHELFARIRSVFAGRAVLLVSHRFSTVREADRIHVLHEGRIVESGDHATLMAQRGRYAELYSLQAAAFQD